MKTVWDHLHGLRGPMCEVKTVAKIVGQVADITSMYHDKLEAIVKDEARLAKNLTNEIHRTYQAADVSLDDIHRMSSKYNKYISEHKESV